MLVMAACSGRLSLDGYFAALETEAQLLDRNTSDLSHNYDAAIVRALAVFSESVTAPDQAVVDEALAALTTTAISETIRTFELTGAELERFGEALGALKPPGQVEAEHQAHQDAVARAIEARTKTIAVIGQVETMEQLDAALTASEFATSQLRLAGTCRRLEAGGLRLGLLVDLRCGGGG